MHETSEDSDPSGDLSGSLKMTDNRNGTAWYSIEINWRFLPGKQTINKENGQT